ncbi:hypothetical protein RugamoR57_37460 [Duganella caerulea]|uniref:hypothetical protein n=1 Tax=Duganella caerulea TaxID=2885762 RepID=UPI0030E90C4A
MSIFDNHSNASGGPSAVPGSVIDVRGTGAAPSGYEYLDGLAYTSYAQGCSPGDTQFVAATDTLSPPFIQPRPDPFHGDTYQFGRSLAGASWRCEQFGGSGPAATSLQFYPAENYASSINCHYAWPAEFFDASLTVVDVLACEQLSLVDGIRTMFTIVSLNDSTGTTQTQLAGAIRWTHDGSTTTVTHVQYLDSQSDHLNRACLAYAPYGGATRLLLRASPFYGTYIAIDTENASMSLLQPAAGIAGPSDASVTLASLSDGTSIVGSSIDNLVRVRRYYIADVEGEARVHTQYRRVATGVAGVEYSDLCLVLTDNASTSAGDNGSPATATFTLIAPTAWYSITVDRDSGSTDTAQIAGRHPQMPQFSDVTPLTAVTLDEYGDQIALTYAVPNAAVQPIYTYWQLVVSRASLFANFVRKAVKL